MKNPSSTAIGMTVHFLVIEIQIKSARPIEIQIKSARPLQKGNKSVLPDTWPFQNTRSKERSYLVLFNIK